MSLLSRLAVRAARAYGMLAGGVSTNVSADFLVVAGGGGGGQGGGGAGGFRTSAGTSGGGASAENSITLSTLNTYSITVGAGGGALTNGSDSSVSGTGLTTITSTGGGKGGVGGSINGSTGGSGGGGQYAGSGGAGTANQGYAGGAGGGASVNYPSGGGGGAGAVGQTPASSSANGGNGGNGVASSISGSSVTYAGGGGGGSDGTAGNGGTGGGANGTTSTTPTAATVNTGGGGGGRNNGTPAGSGGSGIVIISYTSATPKFVGGTITTSGGKQIHTFTSSGTLTPVTQVSASYLVVAGGGGGGGYGGGGAGGYQASSTTLYYPATYIVTVGGGGAGGASAGGVKGTQGTNTSVSGTGITTITSTGGGGGGADTAGGNGGSGGGAGYNSNTGGTATSGQGNNGGGGYASAPNYAGGAGGGAGASGGTSTSGTAAAGGVGLSSSISGTATYYAGGGGGGGTAAGGAGGNGGGGTGSTGSSSNNTAGTTNTGGGGGGGRDNTGSTGGSGVVIISYAGSQVFNGGTVTSSGGNTIHTFYATGALTPITNNLTNSLRFRSSTSAYLSRTPTIAGNRKTWTWSAWVKRGTLGSAAQALLASTNNNIIGFSFTNADDFSIWDGNTSTMNVATTQVFRDPSALYHFVVAFDTTQATASNRVKIYVNGQQVTALSRTTYPTQNAEFNINNTTAQNIGRTLTPDSYFDGYMTDVYFIDGQALEPYYFGSNDSNNVWKPIKYYGTYGTNGFYLTFNNTTSTTTLGYDSSPNGNNWTTNNISLTAGTTYDAMTDVPTNTSATAANYAVLNPVNQSSNTIVDGNLKTSFSAVGGNRSTIGMSSGKWYWEVSPTTCPSFTLIGIVSASVAITGDLSAVNGVSYMSQTGYWWRNNVGTAYGATYTTTDVIGVAVDVDNNTITFYKNGVSQGAITSVTLTGDTWFAAMGNAAASATVGIYNFGQRPFTYTPPTGFVALNTYNLQ